MLSMVSLQVAVHHSSPGLSPRLLQLPEAPMITMGTSSAPFFRPCTYKLVARGLTMSSFGVVGSSSGPCAGKGWASDCVKTQSIAMHVHSELVN